MSILNDMEFVWFTVFVILLTGYAILDGFDLGVGMLNLFVKKDEERRIILNSIGPVWDGNAVWLVTAGGALFAGFPPIYATICSSFYVPVMLLLTGLIFRAVAIEFRSKQPMKWWRSTWDGLFAIASFIIAMGLGSVMGSLIHGIPLNSEGEFIGEFMDLLKPYALLVGLLTVACFFMHGSIYLLMKTEDALHDKLRSYVTPAIIFFILVYAVTTLFTLIYYPHMVQAMKDRPGFFIIAIINIFAIANIPREIFHGRDGRAFISSCVNIICLLSLYGIGTYPNVVRAVNNPEEYSLTIYNSSSSLFTLELLLIIALIGMPLVIAYTIAVYYVFHGKVKIEHTSY